MVDLKSQYLKIQTEIDRIEKQLILANEQLNQLKNLSTTSQKNTVVKLGSLVYTNKAIYFIGGAKGKINVDETTVISVSIKSPIAKAFLQKKAGENAVFNGITFKIEKIVWGIF